MSWERINLADERYAVKPQPPSYCGLIYEGKRHLISGPPEAVKTLLAWSLMLSAIREGVTVAAADFEMGPEATRLLLTELGFTLDEIAAVHYFEPETEPEPADIEALSAAGVKIMLLDALAGAYDASGLDDHKRKEVEVWQKLWTRPLYRAGIASIAIDHVVKNADNRGNFSIGSERKAGTVDVHLGLEVVKPLARGVSGLVKAHIRKDRPGFLRAGGVREIELHSDPITHAITYSITETGKKTTDHWQPTILMEKVSRFLEQQDDPVSRNTVEGNVTGKSRKHVRQAMDELIASGHVTESEGARGARLLTLTQPYTTSPDLAATSPGEVQNDLAHFAPPLLGGEVRGEDEDGPGRISSWGEVT